MEINRSMGTMVGVRRKEEGWMDGWMAVERKDGNQTPP
jgi:hypothetical protein